MTLQRLDTLKARPRQETSPQLTPQTSVESIAGLLAELVAALSDWLGTGASQCAGLREWSNGDELCAWLGIEKSTLNWLRQTQQGPVGHKIGKQIKYRRRDVEDWLAARADPPAGR